MKFCRIKAFVLLMCFSFALIGCGQKEGNSMPSNGAQVETLVAQALAFESQGKKLDAKKTYEQIFTEFVDYKDIEKIHTNLERLNMEILFSNIQTPQTIVYEVASGDSLSKISKKFNITMDLIKRSNQMKTDIVRLGQKLRIWKGKFTVWVDKSQNILLLKSDEDILKTYSVSTGENNSTPIGTFKIVNKLENPIWYKEDGIVIPSGSPENALGSRWLGFDLKGYGIHGTIAPETIGQQMSSGCVRMYNKDVEELFAILPHGTEVTIVD